MALQITVSVLLIHFSIPELFDMEGRDDRSGVGCISLRPNELYWYAQLIHEMSAGKLSCGLALRDSASLVLFVNNEYNYSSIDPSHLLTIWNYLLMFAI